MSQSILNRKKPKADLRNYYTLYLEIGMVVAIVLLLVLFRMPYHPKGGGENFTPPPQETVKMEKVVQTRQETQPPPPPMPQVPVAVPNSQVINDSPIDLNSELNLNSPLSLPPPPPPPSSSTGKSNKNMNQQVFVVVENMPKLIGGLAGLQKKIKYPELARQAGIEGRVYIEFIVNKQGRVVDPKVVRGIGGGCDQEALKVVKQARFVPGMQRGRPVNVRYSLPIVFKLEG